MKGKAVALLSVEIACNHCNLMRCSSCNISCRCNRCNKNTCYDCGHLNGEGRHEGEGSCPYCGELITFYV